MLIQSALLGAGSLDRRLVKPLRARPSIARRYLALEGHRVLAELARQIPLAAELHPDGAPRTATAAESLDMAKSRVEVPDPPRMVRGYPTLPTADASGRTGLRRPPTKSCVCSSIPSTCPRLDDDGDGEPARESKILKLFESPLFNSQHCVGLLPQTAWQLALPRRWRCRCGDTGSRRSARARSVAHSRPLPTGSVSPMTAIPALPRGVGGALYPEWDVHNNRYRPDWCRVIDFPLTVAADVSAAGVPHDDVLRRRLSRIGLGPKVLRGRPDGDELDIEALIDFSSICGPATRHRTCVPGTPQACPQSRRPHLARCLRIRHRYGSGWPARCTTTSVGRPPHWPSRSRSLATASPSTHLGPRADTRSTCRRSKRFGQRFGAVGRARLNQLRPSGYTRLGAGIRGAGEILKAGAGTPNRLLIVLSDGFPYDDGYEGRYAEADAARPSKSSAWKVLPACAFPSARPRPRIRSSVSSAPPAMPAHRPWPT